MVVGMMNKEVAELLGDDHVFSSVETPLLSNAFEKSDEEKIENIPYTVPFYPFTPIIFLIICFFMLYGAFSYDSVKTSLGLIILFAGFPVYYFLAKNSQNPSESQKE